jgi:hypothetical protein
MTAVKTYREKADLIKRLSYALDVAKQTVENLGENGFYTSGKFQLQYRTRENHCRDGIHFIKGVGY